MLEGGRVYSDQQVNSILCGRATAIMLLAYQTSNCVILDCVGGPQQSCSLRSH